MPRSQRGRAALTHPETADIDLLDVLHALSDPTRMTIIQTLLADPERACGTFPVDVARSTLTHHFRVLRASGVIRQRDDRTRRWTTLRRDDLDTRFPGLLDNIVRAYDRANQAVPGPQPLPPRRDISPDSGTTS